MAFETILFDSNQSVATITLNRAKQLNALTTGMSWELLAALKTCARDDAIRCVVLTGAGRAFSAGQDLTEFGQISQPRNITKHLRRGYNQLILALRALEKPVIAKVNGVAAGAGLGLVLAADMVVLSDAASLITAFIGIGLAPDSGVSWHLQQLVGPNRAFELLATGRKVKADEALQWGLANYVVPAELLDETVSTIAARFAQAPTRGIGLTKRVLNRAASMTLEQALDYEAQVQAIAASSDDHQEGVQAFLQKRAPQFTGK